MGTGDIEREISSAMQRYREDRRAEMTDIIRQVVPAAIHQTLTSLGFDVEDPIKMQQDVAFMRRTREREMDPECQLDRDWARRQRRRCDTVHGVVTNTAVAVAVPFVIMALIIGFAVLYRGRIAGLL